MGEEQCTPHSIREKVLDKIILEEIRKATYYARAKTHEFIDIYFRYIGNLTVQPVEQAG